MVSLLLNHMYEGKITCFSAASMCIFVAAFMAVSPAVYGSILLCGSDLVPGRFRLIRGFLFSSLFYRTLRDKCLVFLHHKGTCVWRV